MWDLYFDPTETTFQLLAGHDAARSYVYLEMSNNWTYVLFSALFIVLAFLLLCCWGRPPKGACNAT